MSQAGNPGTTTRSTTLPTLPHSEPPRPLPQVRRQVAAAQARVTPEHADILVPCDPGDLHIGQLRLFVQPAGRFVAQVVETQVGRACQHEDSRKARGQVCGRGDERLS